MYANTGDHIGATVVGDYAYIITTTALQVFDISNLENILDCGSFYMPSFQRPYQIRSRNDHLYITGDFGLAIFNIENPVRPFIATIYDDLGTLHSIELVNTCAYVSTHDSLLVELDVSEVRDVASVGSLNIGMTVQDIQVEDGMAYLGGEQFLIIDLTEEDMGIVGRLDQVIYNFVLIDDYAYMATGPDGLKVIDTSRPDRLREVGHYICFAQNLTYWGGDLYVFYDRIEVWNGPWAGEAIVYIVLNVDDPFIPRRLENYNAGTNAPLKHLYTNDSLIIAGYDGTTDYIHYRTEDQIQQFRVKRAKIPIALESYGGRLFVCENSGPASLWNIHNPIIPTQEVRSTNLYSNSRSIVTINEVYAYFPNGDNIIELNLSQHAGGVFNSYRVLRFDTNVVDLDHNDRYLFALGSNSIHLYRGVFDPRHRREIENELFSIGAGNDIFSVGTRDSTILFYEIGENGRESYELLEYPTTGIVKDFIYLDEFICYIDNQFHVLDRSNLLEELEVDEVSTILFEGDLQSFSIEDSLAYFLANCPQGDTVDAGLYVYDINSLASPELIGYYSSDNHLFDLEVHFPYVYVAENYYLGIYDCRDALSIVGDEDYRDNVTPQSYHLLSSYPNPFNSQSRITYQLSTESHLDLALYDFTGRKVLTLFSGVRPAGVWSTTLDGGELSSGIYFIMLSAGSEQMSQKVALIR